VLELEGAYVQGWDKRKHPVLVAVDLGRGQPVAIGYIDGYNPQAVRRFLQPLVQRLGVSAIVTDDLASFRSMADKLEVEHQVCQFHVHRWVGRTLRELRETVPKDWLWVLEEIKSLLEALPPEGSRRLYEMWKQIPERRVGQGMPLSPLSQLRDMLIRLSEHWPSYRGFDWDQDVPWTNNRSEQVIERIKMRSRRVRGYKSWPGMHATAMLAGSGMAW
jgi:Transposase IS66 family